MTRTLVAGAPEEGGALVNKPPEALGGKAAGLAPRENSPLLVPGQMTHSRPTSLSTSSSSRLVGRVRENVNGGSSSSRNIGTFGVAVHYARGQRTLAKPFRLPRRSAGGSSAMNLRERSADRSSPNNLPTRSMRRMTLGGIPRKDSSQHSITRASSTNLNGFSLA